MIINKTLVRIFVVGWFCGVAACHIAGAQTARTGAPDKRVIEISAEDLAKEFAPETLDPVKKYQNQTLRVRGRVSMAHEPFVYLGTGLNFPTGQPVQVTFEFKPGPFPKVSRGDEIVAEGVFDRAGIFGPIMTKSRIISGKSEPKPAESTSAPSRKEGPSSRSEKKSSSKRQSLAVSKSIALRFDGRVQEGETGYRPECSSFRLRFGPGAWRGTTVGESIAWGEGNQGKDYWGASSGEKTFSSEVYQDKVGSYFVFSLNGTDWESEVLAVLFRLTLPDGRHGVATALIPFR